VLETITSSCTESVEKNKIPIFFSIPGQEENTILFGKLWPLETKQNVIHGAGH
jgi:hypothetical protein